MPLVLLTMLPQVLLGTPFLSWYVSIAFLALIPAGYGFVIYRRNHLGLDVFVTNALTWLLLCFLFFSAYVFVNFVGEHQSVWAELGLLPGGVILCLFLVLVPGANRQTRTVVERILYGSGTSFPDSLLQLTTTLSSDPQTTTLKSVVRQAAEFLRVRQAALLLADHNAQLIVVDSLRANQSVAPISLRDAASSYADLQLRAYDTNGTHHLLFDRYEWIDCFAPLKVNRTVVGLLLLGRPIPDGYYNARQIAFIRQVTGVMAVAAEAIRLFEASRLMSRELIQIRDTERMQLAAQIHDEPLQRISVVTSGLGRLAATPESSENGMLDELRGYRQELQTISKRLRDICAGLHPPVLKQGAQWAVKDVIYAFREKSHLDIDLDGTVPDTLQIPRDLTIAVYYVLNEALNNVEKHARATKVWVRFAYDQEILKLSIEDNGLDNSVAVLSLSTLVRSHQFGIVGMYEWANLVNGELSIKRRVEGGTAVSLTIPFTSKSSYNSAVI